MVTYIHLFFIGLNFVLEQGRTLNWHGRGKSSRFRRCGIPISPYKHTKVFFGEFVLSLSFSSNAKTVKVGEHFESH